MAPAVLIVDDEPNLLRLLVRVFEREGYEVLTATDGDAAIEAFEASPDAIDAVFLDVKIPPQGGGAVLDALLARRPELGIVMASGDQLPAELAERLADGRGVFLRKPFQPKALIETMAQLVRSSSGPSADPDR